MRPVASVARGAELPVARHGLDRAAPPLPRTAGPAGSRSAVTHVAPPSVLTATSVTGPWPDHARPVTVTGPGGSDRTRVKKSGMPGGTMSDRGSMRDSATPSSSASCRSR